MPQGSMEGCGHDDVCVSRERCSFSFNICADPCLLNTCGARLCFTVNHVRKCYENIPINSVTEYSAAKGVKGRELAIFNVRSNILRRFPVEVQN